MTADISVSPLLPIDLSAVSAERALGWLQMMSLIREFETAAEPLAKKGLIPGGMHSSVGQEATAVGFIDPLRATDIVTATHRGHHITLAKGVPPREVMAELFGKATGCVGGRGGHMHLAAIDRGHFGCNGIVGAGLGIALGASLASSVLANEQVSVGFFGDGGANIGRVWEYVNLAVVWRLPLVVVCENNLYAVETPSAQVTGGGDVSARARGFGLPVQTVDGQDVAAVHAVAEAAIERARSGGGPTFVESLTYRHGGHDVGDRETYRTGEEVAEWRAGRDPVARLSASIVSAGLADGEAVDRIVADNTCVVEDAIDFADRSPYPDPDQVRADVTATDMKIRGNR